jgi:dTMP kinase
MTAGPPPPAPGPAGVFIAVEGGDGAGKSTQVRRLAGWLAEAGYPVRATREPGGTELGRALRALLLDRADGPAPRTEALLYAADRAQHVAEVIEPALARGEVVISDRYVDSSLAYQGAGRGLGTAELEQINRWGTAGRRPDLTVLLDVAPALGRRRRGAAPDRLERESAAFHARVRGCLRDRAAADPDRYLVLDAAGDADEVAGRIRQRVAGLLDRRGLGRPRGGADNGPVGGADARR